MRYTISLFAVLMLSLGVVGCSSDDDKDNTSPIMSIQTPQNDALFSRGQSIILNGTFTDDKNLSHVTVTITAAAKNKGVDTPWEATERIELSGKTQTLSSYALFNTSIPSDIMSSGYNIEFVVVDKANNQKKNFIPITIE